MGQKTCHDPGHHGGAQGSILGTDKRACNRNEIEPASLPDSSLSLQKGSGGSESTLLREERHSEQGSHGAKDDQKVPTSLNTSQLTCESM